MSQTELGEKVHVTNKAVSKWENCLYEIGFYPEWQDKAIMEIELRSETQKIVFPDCVKVIREVTGEKAYTNHALAKL